MFEEEAQTTYINSVYCSLCSTSLEHLSDGKQKSAIQHSTLNKFIYLFNFIEFLEIPWNSAEPEYGHIYQILFTMFDAVCTYYNDQKWCGLWEMCRFMYKIMRETKFSSFHKCWPLHHFVYYQSILSIQLLCIMHIVLKLKKLRRMPKIVLLPSYFTRNLK